MFTSSENVNADHANFHTAGRDLIINQYQNHYHVSAHILILTSKLNYCLQEPRQRTSRDDDYRSFRVSLLLQPAGV
jgi:hypothetical protein